MVLGLSLSAPIGPINAAQLDKGLRGGFMPAWVVGLGAINADIIYMLLVYLGMIHLLDAPFVKAFLWLFGFFVLVYSGIESIMHSGQIAAAETRGSGVSCPNRSCRASSCRCSIPFPSCSGSESTAPS